MMSKKLDWLHLGGKKQRNWVGSADFTKFRRALVEEATARPNSPTPEQRRAVWEGKECVYCGNPADAADHVWPRTRGGWDVLENLVPACTSCNGSKHNKLLTEWRGDRVARAMRVSEIVFHSVVREVVNGHPLTLGFFPGVSDMPPLAVPSLADSRTQWLATLSGTDYAVLEPPAEVRLEKMEAITMKDDSHPIDGLINNWLCQSDDTLARLHEHDKGPFTWTPEGLNEWITEGWRSRAAEGRWQVPLSAPGLGLWERRSWHTPPPKALRGCCTWVNDSKDSCWDWNGETIDGYGIVGAKGHADVSTRLHVWTALFGLLPGGVMLWQKCGNHLCINPRHMEPVTWRVHFWRSRGRFWAIEAPKLMDDIINNRVANIYVLLSRQEVRELLHMEDGELKAALASGELSAVDSHGDRVHRDALLVFVARRAAEDAGLEVSKALILQAVTNLAMDWAHDAGLRRETVLTVLNRLTHEQPSEYNEPYTPTRALDVVKTHLREEHGPGDARGEMRYCRRGGNRHRVAEVLQRNGSDDGGVE
jgi:hypothetical protein